MAGKSKSKNCEGQSHVQVILEASPLTRGDLNIAVISVQERVEGGLCVY